MAPKSRTKAMGRDPLLEGLQPQGEGPTFDALAEFVAMVSMRGNAFAIGAKADGSGTIVLNPGPFIGGRALSQAEVLNLVSWLIVVSGVKVEDVCQYVVAVLKGQPEE